MSSGRVMQVLALAGVVAGGLGVTGCLGGGELSDGAEPPAAREELQAGQRPDDTAAIAAACKVCATAISCCEAVGGGPECSFSVATCANLPDVARGRYIDACQGFVSTVWTAWKQSPPAECAR